MEDTYTKKQMLAAYKEGLDITVAGTISTRQVNKMFNIWLKTITHKTKICDGCFSPESCKHIGCAFPLTGNKSKN